MKGRTFEFKLIYPTKFLIRKEIADLTAILRSGKFLSGEPLTEEAKKQFKEEIKYLRAELRKWPVKMSVRDIDRFCNFLKDLKQRGFF